MKDFQMGEHYIKSMEKEIRKAHGKFYTPDYIINFMLDKVFKDIDIVEEPFIKVLDPACGCGFFLIKAYDILKERFRQNLDRLRQKHSKEVYKIIKEGRVETLPGSQYWQEENLHYHILKHCLYGADIDREALWLCRTSLLAKDRNKYDEELNIICCDSLFRWEKHYDVYQIDNELKEFRLVYGIKDIKEDKIEYGNREKAENILKLCKFWSNKYQFIIGNPPYVGHKELNIDYKKWLLQEYKETFKDKSDLSYCFFQRALEAAADKGIIAFISSRYFMESPTGRNLRNFLKNSSKIDRIVDFNGKEIFPGVGVATAIFFIEKDINKENHMEVWKHKGGKINNIHSGDFNIFTVNQSKLGNQRWLLISHEKRNMLERIEGRCKVRLGDIVESFQGVITGCDKAFVMDECSIKALGIEKELLRTWIKNRHIERYNVKDSDLKLIYSDWIDEPAKYPNSIMHIQQYRHRLENRRECRKGLRLWYQLQWGRDPRLFMKEKIVYPFKSINSRFALDTNGCFCSADVYSFILKDGIEGYTLPFLLGVLNSRIYEEYFKLFAKNMGGGIYDYYPNTVMDLMIPDYESCKTIEKISLELMELCKNNPLRDEIKKLENTIDTILEDYFCLKA